MLLCSFFFSIWLNIALRAFSFQQFKFVMNSLFRNELITTIYWVSFYVALYQYNMVFLPEHVQSIKPAFATLHHSLQRDSLIKDPEHWHWFFSIKLLIKILLPIVCLINHIVYNKFYKSIFVSLFLEFLKYMFQHKTTLTDDQ